MKTNLRKTIHLWSSLCSESYNITLQREHRSKADQEAYYRSLKVDLMEEIALIYGENPAWI